MLAAIWSFSEGTIPPNICDEWIERYRHNLKPATIGGEVTTVHNVDIRSSKINADVSDLDVVNTMSNLAVTANAQAFGFDLVNRIETQYSEYYANENGHYSRHSDSFLHKCNTATDRKLTVIVFLSDPRTYAGGELVIYRDDESKRLKLEQGSAVIFPSFFDHEVLPVTQGIRRTMVAWAMGPYWR